MEENVRAYARLRLDRAREEIETARENVANAHYRAAVSRAYYAVFYMASAALFSISIQRSKHSAVEAAFNQFIVKQGQIEPEFSRIYQKVRRQREDADYAEETGIDQDVASEILADSERFVNRLQGFLQELGAISDK